MPRPAPSGRARGARACKALFFPTSFRVMGHIAKADGRVSEQEIAAARADAGTRCSSARSRRAARWRSTPRASSRAFDAQRAVQRTEVRAVAAIRSWRYFFIEMQLHAALAGNGLGDLPRERLQRIAVQLGIGAARLSRSSRRWRAGAATARARRGQPAAGEERLAEAYRVLEIEPSSSDEQVVKAYRRQMSRHHPDKLQANGVPESMLERAKERTQQIQRGL